MTHAAQVCNLAQLLRQTAALHPDRPGLIQGERQWTWREIDARVDALAAALRARGVRQGDRLLVHSDLRSMGPDAAPEPGLWVVQRHFDHTGADPQHQDILGVQGSQLAVTVVASVPLTDEAWRPLPRGTVLEVVGGQIVYEAQTGASG